MCTEVPVVGVDDLALTAERSVDFRITAVSPRVDPHIPETVVREAKRLSRPVVRG